jgi:hypothetical protein
VIPAAAHDIGEDPDAKAPQVIPKLGEMLDAAGMPLGHLGRRSPLDRAA